MTAAHLDVNVHLLFRSVSEGSVPKGSKRFLYLLADKDREKIHVYDNRHRAISVAILVVGEDKNVR